ncbi:hypothetical protein ACFL59_16305, partial [Planctomycetota bacterium]
NREAALEEAREGEKAVCKLVERWLRKRKQLFCGGCKGTAYRKCDSCGGKGKVRHLRPGGGMISVTCKRCIGSGKRSCRDCKGGGYNRLRVDDVLYDPFPPTFRKQLGRKRDYVDQLMRLRSKQPVVNDQVCAVFGAFSFALEPILSHGNVVVRIDAGSSEALVRYVVTTRHGDQEERLTYTQVGEDWHLLPPRVEAEDDGAK